MIRLCWVFVLVAVVVPLSYARPHECDQRERSLADLDLAEDALNRAKDLYPNCEEENESSNSTECSKKDKSLGFLDVALDLVSNAKKNIPICPHVPTEEPATSSQTEKPVTSPQTEKPTPEVTTEVIRRPVDCQDLLAAGHFTSGVYSVWPRGEKSAVRVRCDMDTDGGGWTVFQRRGNFSVQENFDRDWQDYKHGFGNPERDYWLGDSMRCNGRGFTTKDRKNDSSHSNCAISLKGGFWYNYCWSCNPNGLYKPGVGSVNSVFYPRFKGFVGLFSLEMKLKRL